MQIYIGSAQDIAVRFREHIVYSKKRNIRLLRSREKYGLVAFNFLILEYYDVGKPTLHPIFDTLGNFIHNPTLYQLETFYIQSIEPDKLFNFSNQLISRAY